MDNLTVVQRHKNMSNIRSTNTKLELFFFAILEKEKIVFYKYPKLYGKPDCQIGEKLLIFIDSDFWHGWHFQKWKERMPKNYWIEKIKKNMERDQKKFRKLKNMGYTVFRIWEHQIKKDPKKVIEKIINYITA